MLTRSKKPLDDRDFKIPSLKSMLQAAGCWDDLEPTENTDTTKPSLKDLMSDAKKNLIIPEPTVGKTTGAVLIDDKYVLLKKLGSGSYGVVFLARNVQDSQKYALKKIIYPKGDYRKSGMDYTAMREASILNGLGDGHENIIKCHEIIFISSNHHYLVYEACDRDLDSYIKSYTETRQLPDRDVRQKFKQILSALQHLHERNLVHRDVKPENILLKNGVLKLADFGLCRPIPTCGLMTPEVMTINYRAPENLIATKALIYRYEVDLWSSGCVLAYLYLKSDLFKTEENSITQLNQVMKILGTPTADEAPSFLKLAEKCDIKGFESHKATLKENLTKRCSKFVNGSFPAKSFDFLSKFLKFDGKQRISAAQALKSDFFADNGRTVKTVDDIAQKIGEIKI